MKKWSVMCVCALALCGCVSDQQLIESRIRRNQAVFDTYPAETQLRIRHGVIQVGDTAEMVRMAFGNPTRVRERKTAAGTQNIWLYDQYETRYVAIPENQTVYYDSRFGRIPATGTRWVDYPSSTAVERRRVEFKDDRVDAIELYQND